MIRPVAVESNRLKPLTHAFALGSYLWVSTEGSCKGLFLLLVAIRGHDLPLENVDATDSDKRVEQGVCLLGNFGAVKTLVGQNPYKLDKREHLTLVDNLGTTYLIVPSIRSLKAWRNEKTTCKF
jgi:hypothetical protein